MKLSDRDLKLLVLLLIAVVIACPILFVLRPYNTKIQDVENSIKTKKERQAFLAKLNENRQFYNDSIVLLDNERNKIISDFAEGTKEENTVVYLANAERQIPIAMTALTFAHADPTVISEASIDENGNTVEGLSALTSSSTVAFVSSYEPMKDFLKYILDSDKRRVISSFSMDQDDQDGSIKGVFLLNEYAVTGAGRELEPAKVPTVDHGTDNVFGEPKELDEEALAEMQENAEGEGEANEE